MQIELLYQAAFHEAGHAVAALCFELPLADGSICDDGTGYTRYAHWLGRDTAANWAVTNYAGGEAERAAFPFLVTRPGDIGDVRAIHAMLARLDLDWDDFDLAVLRAQARELVECERPHIRAVAAALIEHRHLTADQLACVGLA